MDSPALTLSEMEAVEEAMDGLGLDEAILCQRADGSMWLEDEDGEWIADVWVTAPTLH